MAMPWRSLALAAVLAITWTGTCAATIDRLLGEVRVIRGAASLTAVGGERLEEGDEIDTGTGEVVIHFDDGGRMAVRSVTRVAILRLLLTGAIADRTKRIAVVRGAIRYVSGIGAAPRSILLQTPGATIGIRGTDVEIDYQETPVGDAEAGTYLRVNSGQALLTTNDGTSTGVAQGETVVSPRSGVSPRGPGVPGTPVTAVRRLPTVPAGVLRGGSLDDSLR